MGEKGRDEEKRGTRGSEEGMGRDGVRRGLRSRKRKEGREREMSEDWKRQGIRQSKIYQGEIDNEKW